MTKQRRKLCSVASSDNVRLVLVDPSKIGSRCLSCIRLHFSMSSDAKWKRWHERSWASRRCSPTAISFLLFRLSSCDVILVIKTHETTKRKLSYFTLQNRFVFGWKECWTRRHLFHFFTFDVYHTATWSCNYFCLFDSSSAHEFLRFRLLFILFCVLSVHENA